jgi:hypothetical protein
MHMKNYMGECIGIFADCVHILPSIGNVVFKFCSREANWVGHSLLFEKSADSAINQPTNRYSVPHRGEYVYSAGLLVGPQ